MNESPANAPLSATERQALQEHELAISQGLSAFVSVGLALIDIRDRKLYRPDYKTFENYLLRRWSIGRAQGYRLMEAADVVHHLSPDWRQMVEKEYQARALASVPPHLRQEVLERIAENGEKLTEQTIARVTIALLDEVREQAQEQAARFTVGDKNAADNEPETVNDDEEDGELETVSTENTLRRAAKKVEKPRLNLARAIEYGRLLVKNLRRVTKDDLQTDTARQAVRDCLNSLDDAVSNTRSLLKKVEEEASVAG